MKIEEAIKIINLTVVAKERMTGMTKLTEAWVEILSLAQKYLEAENSPLLPEIKIPNSSPDNPDVKEWVEYEAKCSYREAMKLRLAGIEERIRKQLRLHSTERYILENPNNTYIIIEEKNYDRLAKAIAKEIGCDSVIKEGGVE